MTSTTQCLGFPPAPHPVVSTWDLDAYGLCHDHQKAAQDAAAAARAELEARALRPSVVWAVEVQETTTYGTVTIDWESWHGDRQEALNACWARWTYKAKWSRHVLLRCRVVPFVRADWSGASLTIPIGGGMRAVITPDMYRV